LLGNVKMSEKNAATCIHHLVLILSLAALVCVASAQSITSIQTLNDFSRNDFSRLSLTNVYDDGGDVISSIAATPVYGDEIADDTTAKAEATSTSKLHSTSAPEAGPVHLDGSAAVIRPDESASERVEWKPLMLHSNFFLGVMHGFRIAREPSTRLGMHNSVFGGYFKALGAMHGWSDGDGYYENYLGHPIQGGVSGYLWLNHDPRYRTTEFGTSRDYWMGRLRATAFAWAFSEQFEVGLISEASIGQIQRYCCAYGFVDHIITPIGGLGWMVGEDIIDKYVIRKIEDHTRNRVIRLVARSGLNPPQSFANAMTFHAPWHRTNRAGILTYNGELYFKPNEPSHTAELSPIPKFELAAELPGTLQWGSGSCLGGSGVGAMRLTDSWQWTLQVGGCSMRNMPKNWSGDSLTFTTGPQWIVHTAGRWSPHAHLRFGGQKVTQEYLDPELKEEAERNLPKGKKLNSVHDQYAKDFETTGFSMAVGGGLDLAVHPALAVRVANLEYVRSWLGQLNGGDFDRGFRFSTGIVLRIGTW
jgi:hypothetical protein